MKKLFSLTLSLVFVAVFLYSTALAFDYTRIMPEKPLLIIKFNIKNFLNSNIYESFNTGAIKKAQDEIQAEFEKRTGLVVKRDINEIIVAVSSELHMGNTPNCIGIFITGSFKPEELLKEIEKEPKLKDMIVKKGSSFLIKMDKGFSATFLGTDVLAAGTDDVIEALESGKFKGADVPANIKPMFEKSNFFFSLENSGALKTLIALGMENGKIPAMAKDILAKLESLVACDDYPSFMVRANFSEKAPAEELKKIFDSGLGMAELIMISKEKEINEKIKTASTFELLSPEIAGVKYGLAIGREALKTIELKSENNSAILRLTVPENLKQYLKPEMIPIFAGIAGIGAAIAVPNFKKARSKAQEKSCEANMKVLEGACELYMMDNEKVTAMDIDILLKKGYLKLAPVCNAGGSYKINFEKDLPVIECSKHGKLEIK
ncbi:MAG TPA: hypothetical protein PKK26_13795 [Candidatus Wallbacteria bacterium]|nr:hypothetical protein [Candidatus Wallbacteria bacterium]